MFDPVFIDGIAGILNGSAEGDCGLTNDRISGNPLEYCNFIVMAYDAPAAFVVEQHNVVGLFLNVLIMT
jgi:hypothetical protein